MTTHSSSTGCVRLLTGAPGLEIVGQAATGPEALDLVGVARPDVVVLDLNMPGPGGIATIREITDRAPATHVLVLTMYDDDGLVFEAMKAGASGYVLKGAHPDEVISAVQAVAQGEAVFGAGLARRLADWFARPAPQIRSSSSRRASVRCWSCWGAGYGTRPSLSASGSA